MYEPREKLPQTKAEREAKLEKRRVEGSAAIKELKKKEAAFKANFERLKAERLAREKGEQHDR